MQQALVVFLFELRKTPRVTLGRVIRTGFLLLAEKCFNNRVRAWWEIGKNGELKYCGDSTSEDHYAKGEEIHVWEQTALAACTEELEAWERKKSEIKKAKL